MCVCFGWRSVGHICAHLPHTRTLSFDTLTSVRPIWMSCAPAPLLRPRRAHIIGARASRTREPADNHQSLRVQLELAAFGGAIRVHECACKLCSPLAMTACEPTSRLHRLAWRQIAPDASCERFVVVGGAVAPHSRVLGALFFAHILRDDTNHHHH